MGKYLRDHANRVAKTFKAKGLSYAHTSKNSHVCSTFSPLKNIIFHGISPKNVRITVTLFCMWGGLPGQWDRSFTVGQNAN